LCRSLVGWLDGLDCGTDRHACSKRDDVWFRLPPVNRERTLARSSCLCGGIYCRCQVRLRPDWDGLVRSPTWRAQGRSPVPQVRGPNDAADRDGPRKPAKITSITLVAREGEPSPRPIQIHRYLCRGRAIVLGDSYLRHEAVRVSELWRFGWYA